MPEPATNLQVPPAVRDAYSLGRQIGKRLPLTVLPAKWRLPVDPPSSLEPHVKVLMAYTQGIEEGLKETATQGAVIGGGLLAALRGLLLPGGR